MSKGASKVSGSTRLDVVFVHDPDDSESELPGTFATLVRLKEQGLVSAIGIGMSQWQMPLRLLDRQPIDVILLAGRWSLLDQSAEPLLDAAAQRHIPVVIGGALNSGVLAGPSAEATSDYVRAYRYWVHGEKIGGYLREPPGSTPRCGGSIPAGPPAVLTVLVGIRSPEEVDAFADATEAQVPAQL